MRYGYTLWPALGVLSLAAICGVGGCATSESFTQAETRPAESIEVSADRYDAAMDAARLTLRERGFMIARDDHRQGRMSTSPAASPIVLEVWSATEQSEGWAWRSTLGRLRRVARVELAPADGGVGPAEAYRLSIEVEVERHDPALRRINGSARRVFSQLSQTPEEWVERGVPAEDWRPEGRDPAMEARLLEAISAQLGG
ncbi:MAG: hypothetical protein AAGA57_00660 [Planctomycetota bacterium]